MPPTTRWLPPGGNGLRWMEKSDSRSKFSAISRYCHVNVDVLGHPRTSLDGGPCSHRAPRGGVEKWRGSNQEVGLSVAGPFGAGARVAAPSPRFHFHRAERQLPGGVRTR